MRKQYQFWPGATGIDAWDVDRLIDLTREFPVIEVEIASIAEIDSAYWFFGHDESPTVRRIVDHIRLIDEADLRYPIILCDDGRVMDGMHRIARALLENRPTIRAVKFPQQPEPDFRNCRAADLPYDAVADQQRVRAEAS